MHDRADAELFIRQLFEHVLRLNPAPDDQIAAWTEKAIRINDPLSIFRDFIQIPAHKSRLKAEQGSITRWLPGHFYSSIINRGEILMDHDRIFGPKQIIGVNFNDAEQIKILSDLSPYFSEIPFTDEKLDVYRYYYNNGSYGFGDAVIYWAMINRFRPRQIIEVGSGYTSAMALDTVDLLNLSTVCTFIDPYPLVAEQATAPINPPHRIVPSRIQDVSPEIVTTLGENDILFIDSSHVLKTGSDLHFEMTELLPRLRSGVLIHFHDIFGTLEYPKKWVLGKNPGWNEIYALHLFLMFNSAFKVVYFNDYMARTHHEAVRAIVPDQAERLLINPGGGLWLRKV